MALGYGTNYRYVGEFKDGKFHGQGTYTDKRYGRKYVGQFSEKLSFKYAINIINKVFLQEFNTP